MGVQDAHRPGQVTPRSGITLGAAPAWMLPHTTLTPARGSIRRLSTGRQLGGHLGQGEGQVPGQVRSAGVAAGARQLPPRPGPRRWSADPAAARPGRHRRRDRSAGRRAARPRRARPPRPSPRAAGHHLLGRLEQQPHAAGQQARRVRPGQREGSPDQRGGVHVVATRVGDPLDVAATTGPRSGRGPAARPCRPAARRSARRAELGDQPGRRHPGHRPAGLLDPRRDQRGGPSSRQDSSGCACRSRRRSTSSASHSSTTTAISVPNWVGATSDIESRLVHPPFARGKSAGPSRPTGARALLGTQPMSSGNSHTLPEGGAPGSSVRPLSVTNTEPFA